MNKNKYDILCEGISGESTGKNIKVTFFGTSTLLFDDGVSQILFDANLTRPKFSTAFFGKMSTDKLLVDKIISESKITNLQAIFISHTHYDHVLDAPYIANKCSAVIYGSESALNVGRGGDVPENRLFLFKEFNEYSIGNFKVTVLPSIHSKTYFFNNDIGSVISSPLKQPAKKEAYVEGGSYDFLVTYNDKRFVIRPSYNYFEGAFDNIQADVLFLGIGGLGKASMQDIDAFYNETVKKIMPSKIIPIHCDNFFIPLNERYKSALKIIDNSQRALDIMAKKCYSDDISFSVMLPLSFCRFSV